MTPAQRAYAVRWAKQLATPVVSCVQARLSPCHILDRCSRGDLVALVIVLAEAADPAVLRTVCEAEDDGRPDVSRRDVMLRKARTEAAALRRRRYPVPPRIAALEKEYWRNRKGAQRTAAREDSRAA